jgi:hypothetical protein
MANANEAGLLFLPPYGLEPLLELSAAVWGDLEGHSRRHYDAHKFFVISGCEMIQLLM